MRTIQPGEKKVSYHVKQSEQVVRYYKPVTQSQVSGIIIDYYGVLDDASLMSPPTARNDWLASIMAVQAKGMSVCVAYQDLTGDDMIYDTSLLGPSTMTCRIDCSDGYLDLLPEDFNRAAGAMGLSINQCLYITADTESMVSALSCGAMIKLHSDQKSSRDFVEETARQYKPYITTHAS